MGPKTSLRFLSNLLLGKNRVSWSAPGRNVQGSSTSRKINRPLERNVECLAWSKSRGFPASVQFVRHRFLRSFGNLVVDTNNVFGFNCRERLHQNDVKQSFFYLFFLMLSYQKIKLVSDSFSGHDRCRLTQPTDAAPRRQDLFQALHAFQHRSLGVNSEFLWRTPTAVSASYLSDHISRFLRN